MIQETFESVDQKAVIVQIEFSKGRDDFSPLNAFDEFKELVAVSYTHLTLPTNREV